MTTTWQLDNAHSAVEFSARHMMVSTVRGRFDRFEVTLEADEQSPETSSVVARIDTASINTGQEQRDAHLRSADFLATEEYPEITFRSTRVEKAGQGEYLVTGDLTIRGETHPVTLKTEFAGIVRNLQGGRSAGFSAEAKISRKEWGLTWNVALESGGWLVGDEIKVRIELEVVQAAAAGSAAA
ncbi:MAG TPA: YceI family protein [Candidatus Limnocylindrales bacterium]